MFQESRAEHTPCKGFITVARAGGMLGRSGKIWPAPEEPENEVVVPSWQEGLSRSRLQVGESLLGLLPRVKGNEKSCLCKRKASTSGQLKASASRTDLECLSDVGKPSGCCEELWGQNGPCCILGGWSSCRSLLGAKGYFCGHLSGTEAQLRCLHKG